jgi:hypothetical protein
MPLETFYITTDDNRYFCCSPQVGFHFSDDADDPNIIDGSVLEIKYTKEDTLRQIAEQVKMSKGVHYSRKSLFQHPTEKAWLAIERRNVEGKEEKEYTVFWSRKFKLVTCLSKITEKRQGNSSFTPGSQAAKLANEKSRLAKKKRLANATETAKKLNFDPLKRLALYALGDKDGLGLSGEVKQSTQMKALETYLRYSHQQMKPYSPQEAEKLQNNKDIPTVHVTLPSNNRELSSAVLSHDDATSFEDYLRGAYSTEDDADFSDTELEDEDNRLLNGQFTVSDD